MKKIFLLLVPFLITISIQSYGQDVTKVGTSSAVFLGIDIGARASAMGGAFVAVADDISTLYWNPAGISRFQKMQTSFMYAKLIADTDFNWGAIVVPLYRYGSVGLNITSLSHDDMEVRTIEEPEGTGRYFSAGDLSIGASYAINLTDRFSIGFSGKYIRSQIYNVSSSSVGFDIGTLYITGFRGLRIGATITNFGKKMRMTGRDLYLLVDPAPGKYGSNDRIVSELQTSSYNLPLAFRTGVALDVIDREYQKLTLAIDAYNPSDNTESVNIGMEYIIAKTATLRIGYNSLFNTDSEMGLTVGGGINIPISNGTGVIIDYAYSDMRRLDNIQRFNIILGL